MIAEPKFNYFDGRVSQGVMEILFVLFYLELEALLPYSSFLPATCASRSGNAYHCNFCFTRNSIN